MMRLLNSPDAIVRLAEALRHMSDAQFILDELGAPSEIGTGLDLAIGRLSRLLRQGPAEWETVHQMLRRLEQEFVAICESRTSSPTPWKESPV